MKCLSLCFATWLTPGFAILIIYDVSSVCYKETSNVSFTIVFHNGDKDENKAPSGPFDADDDRICKVVMLFIMLLVI